MISLYIVELVMYLKNVLYRLRSLYVIDFKINNNNLTSWQWYIVLIRELLLVIFGKKSTRWYVWWKPSARSWNGSFQTTSAYNSLTNEVLNREKIDIVRSISRCNDLTIGQFRIYVPLPFILFRLTFKLVHVLIRKRGGKGNEKCDLIVWHPNTRNWHCLLLQLYLYYTSLWLLFTTFRW